jgi:integrase
MSAHRVLDTVRKMYNWAISRDMVERNPCLQVPHPARGRARDRVLNAAEVRALWAACGTLPARYRVPIQLQLLTAQRMGEVRTMRWQDLDLTASWWRIPAETAKNGLSHRVPLSTPALDILIGRYFQCGVHPYVFPSPKVPGVPLSRFAVHKAFTALKRREHFPWVLHDLRRTAASHMAGLGISRLVISKLLNHVEPGITKVYDRHSYDGEKRQALDLWGQYLMALVRGREAPKVVPLRRGA